MKLTQAVIYGFGKFYQKTLNFQDGIHVIYGPNEAGKSTLHTFLGCMLFGLERGRGRAARGDLYTRYLPWDHDATYGGALTLETEEQTYQIQRSFRSERKSCLLAADGQMPVSCSDSDLADHCLEGLTESLYYNTISVRSLGCAPDATLAQELSRQLTDLHQSGSDTIHYNQAANWLRTQRKQQESLLTPDLEQQILTKQQALSQLNARLQNTSFQEQKAALQMDMEDCLEQLTTMTPVSPADQHPDHQLVHRSGRHPSQGSGHRSGHPFLSLLCVLILAAATAWLWVQNHTAAALGTGTLAALLLLLQILRRPQEPLSSAEESDEFYEETSMDHEPCQNPSDFPVQRLRHRMETLQQQYETVCRQEWDHDRLLEQAQTLEEELEQLTQRQAQEEEIRLEIQAIALAASTLQKLSTQMQDDLGPALSQTMSRILGGLTDGIYTQVYVDGQLHVSVQTSPTAGTFGISRTVPLESLSRGTIELVYLAMRLAVIDLLFPQGGMPLILDDCFLAYDDDRLTATLSWLAENYSGQILIFTCQKREAALLRKEQIPFTLIVL